MAVKVGDKVTCSACSGAGYVTSWIGLEPELCSKCGGRGVVKIKPANPVHPFWEYGGPRYYC